MARRAEGNLMSYEQTGDHIQALQGCVRSQISDVFDLSHLWRLRSNTPSICGGFTAVSVRLGLLALLDILLQSSMALCFVI